MDKAVNQYWHLRLQSLKETLEENHFDVYQAADAQQAYDLIQSTIIPAISPTSISWGGSMTFVQSGLYSTLKKQENLTIIDTYDKKIPPEELSDRRRQALLVDLFITGSNAITETGHLVNLDMIGNRVAAITFGPRHVLLLVGRNKIVPNLKAAMQRVKEYAAPANVLRLDKKTPCSKTARCDDCSSPDRICNSWTITEKSFPRGRIKVVLINQDLGL
ncbi:MAG: lactate utilization protein [Desulfobacteraceae bacterium]|jgi:L-lactate utilization protein LutB